MEEQPTAPPPPVSSSPETAPHSYGGVVVGGIVGGVILIALAVIFGTATTWAPRPSPLSEDTSNTPQENTGNPFDALPYRTDSLDYRGPTEEISVAWHSPVPLPELTVGRSGLVEGECGQEVWSASSTLLYDVGTVTSGKYSGGKLLLGLWGEGYYPGPCEAGMTVYRFIEKNGLLTLIATSSDTYVYYLDPSKFTIDTHSIVTGVATPEILSLGEASLERMRSWDNYFDGHHGHLFDFFATTTTYIGNTTLGPAYLEKPGAYKFEQHAVIVKLPDSTIAAYAVQFPFWDDNMNVPQITWSDGGKNTAEFQPYDAGGCGYKNFAAVVTTVASNELQKIGETIDGDPIYGLINPNTPLLQDLYAEYATSLEWRLNTSQEVYDSYQSFINSRPVFFWYDPFNRLIKFESMDIMPLAECGKPVIYLYPEETTTVSVRVDPEGGLSKSDPAYGDGWLVTATPESLLTDLKTGLQYPYLFWEGRGGIYETPKEGFVVAQKDVHEFLVRTLGRLGLNAKETADFIEFWEPRMQGSPYYFVSFWGTRKMNELAPLSISPKPDVVIRVLMDFLPLDRPMSVTEPRIVTPTRKGFTVVEWGGVLR